MKALHTDKVWSGTYKEHRELTSELFLCCVWKTDTFTFEHLKIETTQQTGIEC